MPHERSVTPVRGAIGDVLPFAVVVLVSPINIIAAILLLFSAKPVVNATSYLIGFVIGVAAIVGGLTALAGVIGLSPGSDQSRGASGLLLALGVGLVVMAVRTFRHRPGPDAVADTPKWMEGIAGFGPGKSLLTGLAVGALNPKNIVVALAAAVAVSSAQLSTASQVGVLAVYVVIGSLGVASPIVAVLILGDRSQSLLEGWKSWLDRNNAAMMAVIYLVFGVILVGKGIGGV